MQDLTYIDDTYEQLNQNPHAEVNSDQVEIKQIQGRLEATMFNAILFPEGVWKLTRATDSLGKIVPMLQGLAGKQIVTEGSSDGLGRVRSQMFRLVAPARADIQQAVILGASEQFAIQSVQVALRFRPKAAYSYRPPAPQRREDKRLAYSICDQPRCDRRGCRKVYIRRSWPRSVTRGPLVGTPCRTTTRPTI